jgi:hypothetical protein
VWEAAAIGAQLRRARPTGLRSSPVTTDQFLERARARAAAAIRADPTLTLLVAACWVVHAAYQYPSQYLFRLDPDIWFVQLGAWVAMAAEGLAIGLLAPIAVQGLRAGSARIDSPGVVSKAAARMRAILASRWAPLAVGVVSALLQLYVQGSLNPIPLVHDEAGYLLQAKLYASGHWKAAPAPLPEFFEQMYVFVTPFLASKYPPGFPIALVPATWLGVPGLVPVLLVGVSAGLLFALARSITNPWVGAIAWMLWISDPHGQAVPATIMSEQLSTALWLASWWALARWWKDGRPRHLIWLSFFIGWGAITRPLTMFAFAIPVGAVVVVRVARTRAWKQLAAACGVGLAVLSILPLWCKKTTGSWTVSPLALHVRWYTPYDALGFGPAPSPLRPLPPDLRQVSTELRRSRLRHTVKDIPRLVVVRLAEIRADAFPGWRAALAPLLFYALFLLPGTGLFAGATALLDFTAYLWLSHPAHLTKYYLETYPVLDFLAAAGIWALLVEGRKPRRPDARSWRAEAARSGAVAGLGLLLLLVPPAASGIVQLRGSQQQAAASKTRFRRTMASISDPKAVVFVRYAPTHPGYRSFVENDPDLARERVWIVHDRGADDARLLAIAPDRVPYLYDEASGTLTRMERPSADR